MDEIVELTTRLATALSRLEVVAEQAAAAPSEVDIDAMNVLSVARDATLAEREAEVQKLRAVNQALLDSNADLRVALDASDGEEAAVVASLEAELAALKAEREADRSELDAILTELRPLVEAAE